MCGRTHRISLSRRHCKVRGKCDNQRVHANPQENVPPRGSQRGFAGLVAREEDVESHGVRILALEEGAEVGTDSGVGKRVVERDCAPSRRHERRQHGSLPAE